MSQVLRLSSAIALSGLAFSAQATNGYFTHASSVRAQGMAGVSVAMAHDALAAASNPAAISALSAEQQLDAGITYFKPERSADIHGNGFGIDGHYDGNDSESFLMPELGFARKHSDHLSYGLALYGNGGMNTDYGKNPFANFGAQGSAGVNLEQLFITSTVAYQFNDQHALGLGLTWVRQQFEAKGIQPFAGMSQDGSAVSNQGVDTATGWGVKLGWQGNLSDSVTLGASWSSAIRTDGFDRYRGLFAENGGFDIPENYSAGVAWQVIPALTLAADWQFIGYGSVRSIANELDEGGPLGADNGSGFGWESINVYKIGVEYDVQPGLTLRAGFSYCDQPVLVNQTFFNILAPGVIQKHASLGATYAVNDSNDVSVAYTHGFEETVHGSGSIPANFGGGEADITMFQNQLALGWQVKF
ncbi:OmpP1/FadL family transporter [Thalassolituus pacificus]|uniref:Outer membrane protein transport protein n=1 Tax=Thalassolituus pacificus TaxID=2975440 RepID=A0A9X3AGH1_9GAMM|nr:outer membrane protein transport protein [Thalassolituus pacificus]MCT7359252.1 outer membrane protein transport protein [Thalassolituus pacificus]